MLSAEPDTLPQTSSATCAGSVRLRVLPQQSSAVSIAGANLEAIQTKLVEGCSPTEIARKMGISRGTVYNAKAQMTFDHNGNGVAMHEKEHTKAQNRHPKDLVYQSFCNPKKS